MTTVESVLDFAFKARYSGNEMKLARISEPLAWRLFWFAWSYWPDKRHELRFAKRKRRPHRLSPQRYYYNTRVQAFHLFFS